jgi:membrane associated rhomboid family serine protease
MTTPRPHVLATTLLAALLVAAYAAELAYGVAGDESALVTVGALKTVGWTFADTWRIATGIAVGASGGDCGLLAAALVLVWRHAAPTAAERGPRRWLVVFAVLALAVSLLPGVSAIAHVGGFIGGGAAMYPYPSPQA